MHSCDVAGGHDYVYENIIIPATCEFGRPTVAPFPMDCGFAARPQSVRRILTIRFTAEMWNISQYIAMYGPDILENIGIYWLIFRVILQKRSV